MTDPLRDHAVDPRLQEASDWFLHLKQAPLSATDRDRLHAWLTADPANRRALEDCVGVWRAVGEDTTSAPMMALRREALESFESANQRRTTPAFRSPRAKRLIAAGVTLTVLIAAFLTWANVRPDAYSTGLGERRVVVLEDGSKLSLDAATQVQVRYTKQARELRLLTGRAKFDVASNPVRPFTVTAADKTVRAMGTSFSVELLQKQVRVVLYEGRVAVLDSKHDNRPPPLPTSPAASSASPLASAGIGLRPGQELVVSDRALPTHVSEVDPTASLGWEEGELSFKDEPLALAVERMNRYSNEQLSIGDLQAASVRISGVFKAGDVEAFVTGVTGVFPVVAQPNATGIVLFSRR